MSDSIRVLGSANAGQALAGELARLRAGVVLWNRTPDHIAEIADLGGVELEDEVTASRRLLNPTNPTGI